MIKGDLQALANIDPFLGLTAAMFEQAVKDFRDPDPIKSLDAFCWILDTGSHWFGMMGVYMSEDDIFEKVVQI